MNNTILFSSDIKLNKVKGKLIKENNSRKDNTACEGGILWNVWFCISFKRGVEIYISSNFKIACFDCTPTALLTTFPSLITTKVGMLIMP